MKLFFGVIFILIGIPLCITVVGAIIGIPLLIVGGLLIHSWRMKKLRKTIMGGVLDARKTLWEYKSDSSR